MAVFAIADLHLSLGTNKPMDIFKGWTDYVERIEANWRRLVAPEDTVVVAGDISWALKLEETAKDFAFLNQLPGRKIFIKGNHDLWWSTRKKMEDFCAAQGFETIFFMNNNAFSAGHYALCGTRGWFFDDPEAGDQKILLREAGRLRTSIEAGLQIGKQPVVFLHYPPIYQENVCYEIMDVLTEYHIERCYYGHIHGPGKIKAAQGVYFGVEFRLISCDQMQFVPLQIG